MYKKLRGQSPQAVQVCRPPHISNTTLIPDLRTYLEFTAYSTFQQSNWLPFGAPAGLSSLTHCHGLQLPSLILSIRRCCGIHVTTRTVRASYALCYSYIQAEDDFEAAASIPTLYLYLKESTETPSGFSCPTAYIICVQVHQGACRTMRDLVDGCTQAAWAGAARNLLKPPAFLPQQSSGADWQHAIR